MRRRVCVRAALLDFVRDVGRKERASGSSGSAHLFQGPLTKSPEEFDKIAAEWAAGNYVRVTLVLIVVLLAVTSLVQVARAIP